MKDFRYEAGQFREIDIAALARIEATDALRYMVAHRGRVPDNLSVRAVQILCDGGLCPVCGVQILPLHGVTTDGRLIGSCQDAFTVEQWIAPADGSPGIL